AQLYDTLAALSPRPGTEPVIVVLTPGVFNSAYFEHAYLAQSMGVELVVLVDQRKRRHKPLVAEAAHAHLVEKARVDLVDDLEMPRQHAPEQIDRPALERLGQESVIRVRESHS